MYSMRINFTFHYLQKYRLNIHTLSDWLLSIKFLPKKYPAIDKKRDLARKFGYSNYSD